MIEILKTQTFQEFLAENMGNSHVWSWYNTFKNAVDEFQPQTVLLLQDLQSDFNFPKMNFSGKKFEIVHGPYSWFQLFENESDAVVFTLLLDRLENP